MEHVRPAGLDKPSLIGLYADAFPCPDYLSMVSPIGEFHSRQGLLHGERAIFRLQPGGSRRNLLMTDFFYAGLAIVGYRA